MRLSKDMLPIARKLFKSYRNIALLTQQLANKFKAEDDVDFKRIVEETFYDTLAEAKFMFRNSSELTDAHLKEILGSIRESLKHVLAVHPDHDTIDNCSC